MRDALRASAATVLVPGAIVAVLLATALGSGLGGLGSLRQLVAGPSLPVPTSAATPVAARHVPRLPVVPVSRAVAGGAPAPAAAVAAHPPSSASGANRVPAPAPTPVHLPVALHRPAPHGPRPSSSSGGQRPSSPSPPPRQPDTVHQVAGAVQRAVAPAPVVGPPAADAVGTVVNLVDPGGQPGAAHATGQVRQHVGAAAGASPSQGDQGGTAGGSPGKQGAAAAP